MWHYYVLMLKPERLFKEFCSAKTNDGKAPAQFIEVMACEGGCVTGPCTHADKTAGQKQLIKELTKF